jgi:hypothetical protein
LFNIDNFPALSPVSYASNILSLFTAETTSLTEYETGGLSGTETVTGGLSGTETVTGGLSGTETVIGWFFQQLQLGSAKFCLTEL